MQVAAIVPRQRYAPVLLKFAPPTSPQKQTGQERVEEERRAICLNELLLLRLLYVTYTENPTVFISIGSR